MNSKKLPWRSLRLKVVSVTLVFFLGLFWVLSLLASQLLQKDMDGLESQQYSLVSIVLLASLLMTLSAAWLSRWLLKRYLFPLFNAVDSLATMSDSGRPLQALPVTRNDEIGQLISSFNRLLKTLELRENALRESEERYRTLVDWTPETHVVHRDGKLIYVNPAAIKKYGAASAKELIGKSVFELIHPDYHQIVLERLKNQNNRHITTPMIEEKFFRGDGSLMDVEVQSTTIVFDGKPALFTVAHDITERKQIEAALASSEARYRRITEGLTDYMYTVRVENARAVQTTQYPSCERVTGYTPDAFVADPTLWLNMVVPEDRAMVLEHVQEVLGGKDILPIEHRIIRKDGEVRWVKDSIILFKDDAGKLLSYDGVIRDITERKQAEQFEQFRSHILELLAGDEALVNILEAIVWGVERLNPATICSILLLDRTGRHFESVVAPGLPDYFNNAVVGMEIGAGVGSCGAAAFAGERIIVKDIATHPNWAPFKALASQAKLGACWSQPIRSASGQIFGAFAIYHHEVRSPAESDIDIIEQSARLTSIAIEKSRVTESLRDSEQRFRSLMEIIPSVAAQGYALDGTVTFWNQASERLYGFKAEEAVGKNLLDLIIPAEMKEGVKTAIAQMAESGEPIQASELQLKHKSGRLVPVFSSHALVKSKERQLEMFCLDIDLTARKQAEEKLHLAANVFSHVRDGISITDAEGNIIDVNEAFSRITGYSHDEVLGRNPRILKSGYQSAGFYVSMWQALIEKGQWSGEIWNRRKNGEIYAELLAITAVRDAHGKTQQYIASFSDISAQKAYEKQLEHMAHYDDLTDLPNRVLLADRMRQAIAHSQRRGQSMAVVYLDVDGFKTINDIHGHEIGDQFLMILAGRMKQVLREGDTLARLGGDEFVAVLLDLADISSSVTMLNRLLGAASQPMVSNEIVIQVSASLGLSFFPQAEEVDEDQLIRQADHAMYQAKLAGKNRFHIFDAEQDRSVRGHHESLEHIRCALEKRQFVLYYQPKVNMRTGTVIGAEALIRWQHPEKGLLPPVVFLPVIEDHPLAVDIGEWVIDSALSQIALWQAEGLNISVSVNIGARQLQQSDFVERLHCLLAAHPAVKPSSLEMEVLETSALEDLARISKVIADCQKIGVSFALDDFGTGYSSLTYLKSLSADLLKIDQSFVRDMLDDPDDLSILVGVLNLASAFRHKVIAEGVETVEHGTLLLQLGCELAQGYGIARPMPAHLLPAWALEWKPDAAWSNLPAVDRDDLPLLFACVEHRAWLAAFELYIKGEREHLPLIHYMCRFTEWLNNEGLDRHGEKPLFKIVEALHAQVHDLAGELLHLHTQGKALDAIERLGELHSLRNDFFRQLKALMQVGGG